MRAGLAVPPVVLVMVCHDPGDWFEETLESVSRQEYTDLSVLVIDTASSVDPTERIAAILPSAFVRRLDGDPGFGAAANLAHTMVDGAAFYLFCHDDVALEPGAVRSMVEEAFRSNGGLVTPKILDWDDPDQIHSVGMSADKFGYPMTFVEPGELDQEQHDAVRDVFLAPGGCVLARADLFEELGGFDDGINFLGDALVLSWRSHIAGARVIVAPEAVVRHRQVLSERPPGVEARELEHRHRLRVMLSNYSWFHLVRVLPQYALLTFGQLLLGVFTGRLGRARSDLRAIGWNLGHLGEIRENRRAVKAIRRVPDSEVRALQARGSAQLAGFFHRVVERDDRFSDLASRSRGLGHRLRDREARPALLTMVALVVVGIIGSRHILSTGMAQFGEFAAFGAQPWPLVREFFSTSQASGVGADGVPPTAFGLLGAAGTLFFGQMALLRTVLSIGLIPVGGWATWRVARRLGCSHLAATAALVAMVAMPLPYNALVTGSWSGLLMWAVAPLFLHGFVRALQSSRIPTVDPDGADPGTPGFPWRLTIGMGLLLFVVAAFVPFAFFVVIGMMAGLFVGSLLAGRLAGSRKMFEVGLGASLLAGLLHLPWFLGLALDGFAWASIGGTRFGGEITGEELLRLATGPHGAGFIGWAFPLAAIAAVVVGRQWRRVWAIRLATLGVFFWLFALVAEMGLAPFALPRPEVLLAPTAAAVAVLVGLAVTCFELDLADARFGWRQVAVGIAAVAALAGTIAWGAGAYDGRWDSPDERVTARLALFQQDDEAWYRTLWLGESDDLPVAGWPIQSQLAWGLNDAGVPTVRDRFVDEDPATTTVGNALAEVLAGNTQRFGPLLLGSGVRYVVVPLPTGSDTVPPQLAAVEGRLDQQLDLERLNVTSAMLVYRNTAWVPAVAAVPPGALAEGRTFETALGFPTDEAHARLADDEPAGSIRFTGDLEPADEALLVGIGAGGSWELLVDGRSQDRSPAFGWASSYGVDPGGVSEVELTRGTSTMRIVVVVVQLAAVGALAVIWWRRKEMVR